MDLEPKGKPEYEKPDGIIFVDGLFFIKKSHIKKNGEMVKKTLQDLYRYVSYN